MPLPRLYLSPPDIGSAEIEHVLEAFQSNWIAPAGPNLDAFEEDFAVIVGSKHAVAVSSGTAALHLALRLAGVGPGDEVLCSSLTFIASAAPITYLGAKPVFIDSEERSWNMDPALACAVIEQKAKAGKKPKALVLVHLYGQSADITPIKACCDKHGVKLIEDAAEALGATYGEASPGSFGLAGIHSFNGNKIITTGGGGMPLRIISIPLSAITIASAISPPVSDSVSLLACPAKSPVVAGISKLMPKPSSLCPA
jgi:dTDP-4-amino-4,6-dideoxygalactose transaminase